MAWAKHSTLDWLGVAPVIGDPSVNQVVAMVSTLEDLDDVVPLLTRCAL